MRDELEAYKWYLLARTLGNELTKKKIQCSEEYLTAAERAEGQRWAREWKPKKQLPADGKATGEEVAAKLKETNAKERKFEDVVKSAEQATVLVLVY